MNLKHNICIKHIKPGRKLYRHGHKHSEAVCKGVIIIDAVYRLKIRLIFFFFYCDEMFFI